MPDSDASVSSMVSLYKSPRTRSEYRLPASVKINLSRFANTPNGGLMPGACPPDVRIPTLMSINLYLR